MNSSEVTLIVQAINSTNGILSEIKDSVNQIEKVLVEHETRITKHDYAIEDVYRKIVENTAQIMLLKKDVEELSDIKKTAETSLRTIKYLISCLSATIVFFASMNVNFSSILNLFNKAH